MSRPIEKICYQKLNFKSISAQQMEWTGSEKDGGDNSAAIPSKRASLRMVQLRSHHVPQYNLSNDNSCNGDLNVRDPMLGSLQNNGGPDEDHGSAGWQPCC